jgi:hypothetical protein
MRKAIAISILVVAVASASLAGEQKNVFVSEDLGISIEVPISKESEASVQQVAMFFLPSSDGFTANVNIQKQRYSESMEAYDKLSTNQFTNFNWTVLNRRLKNDEVVYEYKGDMQGKTLHWYARAIRRAQYIYLVTATCLDSRWQKQKIELMKSIDSFKIKN